MSNEEENSLKGRIKRYARVSGTMGNLAAKLAGQKYLGIEINQEDHARVLKEALGNLKGPLMKIAQLLSTIPEALPKEYVAELSQLQSNAPAMGWSFVRRRMKAELGSDKISSPILKKRPLQQLLLDKCIKQPCMTEETWRVNYNIQIWDLRLRRI